MQKIRQISCFETLDDEQFSLLSSFSKKRCYDQGSILFYEKEMPKTLTILVSGLLKVYKTDPKNNEIIMHRFKPISLIAEMAVLEGIPYPASAAFETDGEVIEIDFEKFKAVFFKNPELSFGFFKSLSLKIKYLEDVIALNVVLDSTARLAKFVYEHREELKTLKHYQVAEQLHMTPETLSRTFKKLVVLELIEKDKKGYTILNEEGLAVLFES